METNMDGKKKEFQIQDMRVNYYRIVLETQKKEKCGCFSCLGVNIFTPIEGP